MERKGLIKFAGKEATVVGADIQVGQKAPPFTAHATDWSNYRALQKTRGKVRIIAAVPSLNTAVCDRETRRFNQEAANLDKRIAILVISTDLPFALKEWCGAAGIDQVITLSDHKNTSFGKRYGVLIKEPRVLRRAVFVVDAHDIVVYAAYMPALGEEPNYAEVLAAAQKALRS